MRKTNKKGFTIVELVIVIAVIAILAAVLIPTFISLTKKANQSADIQAVNQMNKQLVIANAETPITNVADAIKALDKVNIDLENYKAMASDHYFYFVVDKSNVPMIIYVDAQDNILYPERADVADQQWMSLSGLVPMKDYTESSSGSYTITSGAQLAKLISDKKDASSTLTITLEGDIDLKGAAVDFGTTKANITIQGSTNTTLRGLRADSCVSVSEDNGTSGHSYGFGIFGSIESGTVTIKNVTISGLSVGNTALTHIDGANTVGLVAGYIKNGATVELENVTFKDCIVNGHQKVGGIVGQLHGTLNMTNVKFENCVVTGGREVAKIGVIMNNNAANLTVSGCDFSGMKVLCNAEKQYKRSDFTSVQTTYTDSTAMEVNVAFSGDSGNVYSVYNDSFGGNGPKNVDIVFGGATNDWVWYSDGMSATTRPAVKIGNTLYCVSTRLSASCNFVNGQPQTN